MDVWRSISAFPLQILSNGLSMLVCVSSVDAMARGGHSAGLRATVVATTHGEFRDTRRAHEHERMLMCVAEAGHFQTGNLELEYSISSSIWRLVPRPVDAHYKVCSLASAVKGSVPYACPHTNSKRQRWRVAPPLQLSARSKEVGPALTK